MVGFTLSACVDGEKSDSATDTATQEADTDTDTDTDMDTDEEVDRIDLENGKDVHDESCVRCRSSGSSMGTRMTGAVPLMTDEELAEVIRDGVGTMPAQGHLSDDDVRDVVGYLRAEVGS